MSTQAEINTDHESRIKLLEHRTGNVEASVKSILKELTSLRRAVWALVVVGAMSGGAQGGAEFIRRFVDVLKLIL